MPQTKREIEARLAALGIRPRHRFGQNFMIDQNMVRVVAGAGQIQPGDMVVEVGPGTGTLTQELLSGVGESGKVVIIEIDRDLAADLRERFAKERRLALIQGDALAGKHALNPEMLRELEAWRKAGTSAIRLVANLPYNIASPLVVELLLAGVDVLAFTVQKEVADRLRATPACGKNYGPLSIIVQSLADVEVLRTIPPQAFWPQPKVESALVRLRRRVVDESIRGRERQFARFVTDVFSSRRKTLRKSLERVVPNSVQTLAAVGLTGNERPEQLEPAKMQLLYREVGAADSPVRTGDTGVS